MSPPLRPPPVTPDEFTPLLVAVLPDLYRLAAWLVRDDSKAEDLVQEASLRAFKKFSSFERGTNFKAWIFRILYNHNIDVARRARHEPRERADIEGFEPPAPPDAPLPEALSDLDLLKEHLDGTVAQAIQELAIPYRDVFLLYALGDLTYEEIARTLEVPIGTVMSRLFRARGRLQSALLEYAAREGLVKRGSTSR